MSTRPMECGSCNTDHPSAHACPNPKSGLDLPLGGLVVEHFVKSFGEDVWLGTVTIFGQNHHFQAIRVENTRTLGWVATNDPNHRLDDLYGVYDEALIPTEIPGFVGHYMICVFPFAD